MKNLLFIIAVLLITSISSCTKRKQVSENKPILETQYDTTAIDSFKSGATSVEIMRQIKMSSQKYKDSLKEVLKLQEEQKRIEKELEKERQRESQLEKVD